MSISLPNGTLLAAPSSSTVQYTAAVTCILHLANFSAELKTRDLQAMFREYENDKGGFRIKWLDDVNALVVFADAMTAKKAYLSLLLHPPPHFGGQVKPYDKPDAAQIIQSLAARTMGHRGSASNATSASFSLMNGASGGEGGFTHQRTMSNTAGSTSGTWSFPGGMGNGNGLNGGAKRTSISGQSGPPNSTARHHRASSSSTSGISRPTLGSGVFNFNSGGIGRLPTHREAVTPTALDKDRKNAISPANSSDTEPIISMDPPNLGSAMNGGWKMGQPSSQMTKARRESMSAEKAMREVEKALASTSVDVHG